MKLYVMRHGPAEDQRRQRASIAIARSPPPGASGCGASPKLLVELGRGSRCSSSRAPSSAPCRPRRSSRSSPSSATATATVEVRRELSPGGAAERLARRARWPPRAASASCSSGTSPTCPSSSPPSLGKASRQPVREGDGRRRCTSRPNGGDPRLRFVLDPKTLTLVRPKRGLVGHRAGRLGHGFRSPASRPLAAARGGPDGGAGPRMQTAEITDKKSASLTPLPPSSNPLSGDHGWAVGASCPFSTRAAAVRPHGRGRSLASRGLRSPPPSASPSGSGPSCGWSSRRRRPGSSSTRGRGRRSSASSRGLPGPGDPVDHRQPALDHHAPRPEGRPARAHPPHVPRRAAARASTRSSATSPEGDRDASAIARRLHRRQRLPARAPQAQRAARRPRASTTTCSRSSSKLNDRYFDGGDQRAHHVGQAARRRKSKERASTIKLGSYSAVDRLIRVHPALDQKWVPRYFVAYIVYHEMLHHVIPGSRGLGRVNLHPPEFKEREKRVPPLRARARVGAAASRAPSPFIERRSGSRGR